MLLLFFVVFGATLLLGVPVSFSLGLSGAAVYALFIGLFVTRELTLADVYRIVLRAGTITATVLLLIGVGNVAGWFFAVNQVPQRLASFMISVAPGPGPFLVFTILILLVAGCLLDTSAALVLLVPILIPIASHYGFNPYHFGFVVVLDLMIGLITPPVGVVLFVCVGLHKDLTIENLVRALPPFYLVELVVLLLSAFVPEMVLVVPRLLGLL